VSDEASGKPTGPRGGTTTVTESGLVKKNLWFPMEDAEWLRRVAYERHVSEADVIRLGITRLRAMEEAGEWPKG